MRKVFQDHNLLASYDLPFPFSGYWRKQTHCLHRGSGWSLECLDVFKCVVDIFYRFISTQVSGILLFGCYLNITLTKHQYLHFSLCALCLHSFSGWALSPRVTTSLWESQFVCKIVSIKIMLTGLTAVNSHSWLGQIAWEKLVYLND